MPSAHVLWLVSPSHTRSDTIVSPGDGPLILSAAHKYQLHGLAVSCLPSQGSPTVGPRPSSFQRCLYFSCHTEFCPSLSTLHFSTCQALSAWMRNQELTSRGQGSQARRFSGSCRLQPCGQALRVQACCDFQESACFSDSGSRLSPSPTPAFWAVGPDPLLGHHLEPLLP